jgi:hypothetical protein
MNGIPNPTIGFQTSTHSKLEAFFSICSFCQCCELINSIQPFFEWGITTHCMLSSPSEYAQNFKKMYDPVHKTKIQNKKPNFFFSIMNGFLEFHGVYRSTKMVSGNFYTWLCWLILSHDIYYFVTRFFNYLQSKGRPTMCSKHSS